MTKIELIDAIAASSTLTKQQTAEALDVLSYIAVEQLGKGGSIKLPGIGTFEPHEIGPRTARNPRTGAQITVPAKTRVAFSASATLKKALNP